MIQLNASIATPYLSIKNAPNPSKPASPKNTAQPQKNTSIPKKS